MALLARFEPTNMNADTYAEVLRRLDAAGLAAPRGRIHHLAYGDPASLHVVDVWDTTENFRAFGAKLFPILAALKIDVGEPQISPVHNVVRS